MPSPPTDCSAPAAWAAAASQPPSLPTGGPTHGPTPAPIGATRAIARAEMTSQMSFLPVRFTTPITAAEPVHGTSLRPGGRPTGSVVFPHAPTRRPKVVISSPPSGPFFAPSRLAAGEWVNAIAGGTESPAADRHAHGETAAAAALRASRPPKRVPVGPRWADEVAHLIVDQRVGVAAVKQRHPRSQRSNHAGRCLTADATARYRATHPGRPTERPTPAAQPSDPEPPSRATHPGAQPRDPPHRPNRTTHTKRPNQATHPGGPATPPSRAPATTAPPPPPPAAASPPAPPPPPAAPRSSGPPGSWRTAACGRPAR